MKPLKNIPKLLFSGKHSSGSTSFHSSSIETILFLKVVLIDERGNPVDAVIRPFTPIQDVLSWYIDWFPLMYDLAGNRLYEDSHWRITDYWEEISQKKNFDILIIEAKEKIQGYVTIKYDHKSYLGNQAVYIPFVASAPWNRKVTRKDRREFKNIGKNNEAGTIVGGRFLLKFIEGIPWAHLDIAGSAWSEKETGYHCKGPTGVGIRMILAWLQEITEKQN